MTDASDEHPSPPYPDPVSRLLGIGEPPRKRNTRVPAGSDWLDYRATHDIGPDHVDELIRMACDPALNTSEERDAEVWGPLHAWRALGRLRAAAATAPLLALAQRQDLDDWIATELPTVFGMTGEPAIRPIGDFLADPATSASAGGTAIAGLTEIAQRHPEYRAECIALLEQTLRRRDREDMELNGSAVAAVLDLKAVEAIEAVRDAFRRDAVDLMMAGDVEDVEMRLGLRKRRDTPRPRPTGPHAEIFERLRSLMQARTQASEARKTKKVGRNDPCPCGSGRKYKKCCGSSTNDGSAPV